VRQQTRIAALLTILNIVVQGMMIATGKLKSGKQRIRLSPGRNVKRLPDLQILKIRRLGKFAAVHSILSLV
jgi:hypothetical protein